MLTTTNRIARFGDTNAQCVAVPLHGLPIASELHAAVEGNDESRSRLQEFASDERLRAAASLVILLTSSDSDVELANIDVIENLVTAVDIVLRGYAGVYDTLIEYVNNNVSYLTTAELGQSKLSIFLSAETPLL